MHDVGDSIISGEIIGRMGSSGLSSANHIHFDLIEGFRSNVYKLKDIPYYIQDLKALLLQYYYFLDSRMFGTEILITTYFGDPDYYNKDEIWKFHPAFDVVPKNRHSEPGKNFNIFWNRSKVGVVLAVGYDEFYGNYINIGFEA